MILRKKTLSFKVEEIVEKAGKHALHMGDPSSIPGATWLPEHSLVLPSAKKVQNKIWVSDLNSSMTKSLRKQAWGTY